MSKSKGILRQWLSKQPSWLFCAYAIMAAFSTYACMYAFRKPVSVALFADASYWGVSLKVLYLSSQMLGYALSKVVGIKFIAELKQQGRAAGICKLIGLAALALLGFALVPPPYNIPFMFLNGLPLGMVWGFVFSYLEGRRVTEVLAAGLCTSFIVASGVVKSVGSYLMLHMAISEHWMPLATALLFVPLLVSSVWLLDQLPSPNQDDIAARRARVPMDKAARLDYLQHYGRGLAMLTLAYVLLSLFRDLRDNFVADIWADVGISGSPLIYTLTEVPVALMILSVIAMMMLIKSNRRALAVNHLCIGFGCLITAAASWLYWQQLISPVIWMVSIGMGLYLAYVPFNSVLFERLLACTDKPGNAGFLIYIADACGYVGSVALMLSASWLSADINWVGLIKNAGFWVGIIGMLTTWLSWRYFSTRLTPTTRSDSAYLSAPATNSSTS
ncbi:DUF5690 family protein [Bowmanella denitrificans]|uniref:DUF5690 family protein n=1 Tax=Bowmanella denitrificans TaxID=366582 RepID=UPI0031E42A4D